jgi:8-amino-7-oxononanoate synthase
MPRPDLLARLRTDNQTRANQAQARSRLVVTPDGGRWLKVNGARVLDFSSNDYLGLANDPRLIAALTAARAVGAGASALVSGYSQAHADLEQALAAWLGRERAVLFSTGFMANLGVVQTLLQRGELLVQDKLNHASLLDAAAYAQTHLARYRHLDVASARQQLNGAPDAAAVLATDSVFSMDGDAAPIADLEALCAEQNATFLVDEAHALGVCGPNGAGLAHARNAIVIGTFGKALGSFGAFVAGSDALIQAILNTSRPYRYTTALPPAIAEATLVAVGIARNADTERAALADRIAQFRRGAATLRLLDSNSQIQPVVIGDDARALVVEAQLLARGFLVRAIRPPTVRAGTARLRVSLSAAHSAAEVAALLEALHDVC